MGLERGCDSGWSWVGGVRFGFGGLGLARAGAEAVKCAGKSKSAFSIASYLVIRARVRARAIGLG